MIFDYPTKKQQREACLQIQTANGIFDSMNGSKNATPCTDVLCFYNAIKSRPNGQLVLYEKSHHLIEKY